MPVEQDAKLNEELKPIGRGNLMPNGVQIYPREMGKLGVRLIFDQLLMSVEGMGIEQLEALDISLRDIAEHRSEIEDVIVSIVHNEGRHPQRQKARTAAIRIAGHLKMQRILPTIREVLRSQFEPPSIRAAAADAIGLMRSHVDAPLLERYLHDAHDIVARSTAIALGKIGGAAHIDLLKQRFVDTPNEGLRRSLEQAVNRIEERENIGLSKFEKVRPKAQERLYTEELDIEVGVDRRPVIKRR